MADVDDTLGTFVVTRLRSEDASFLSGAVNAGDSRPMPIAIARGPVVQGPSGTVTVNGFWTVAVPVPAVPEVVWVLTSAQVSVMTDESINTATNVALIANGNLTQADENRAPVLNLDPQALLKPGAGTNWPRVTGFSPSINRGLWMPLDPIPRAATLLTPVFIGTTNGFTPLVVMQVATEALLNDIRIDLTQVTLVGYPINAWNSAWMWSGAAFRGS